MSQVYEVVLTAKGEDTEDMAFGAVNTLMSRIALQSTASISPIQQVDTLLHECLHAAFFTAGLRYHLFQDDHESEEHTIRVLAPLLLHLFRENPALVRYLLQPLP